MRRALILFLASLILIGAATAQIGKQVILRAGTPEDLKLREISAATDPAKKLELLQQFLAEFGQTDAALIGYELLVSHYLGEKNYDQAFEAGEKALALDPDDFTLALDLFRGAQEKGDWEKLFVWGERIGAIVERYRQRAAPENMPEEVWTQRKAETLANVAGSVNYVEATLFNAAYQVADPKAKAALFERYLAAFPSATYGANAEAVVAALYQQTQNYAKMLEFAQRILTRDPNNYGMLLLLADYWSERGEQLDRAEAHARKALELLDQAQRPAQVPEEQWQQQIGLQKGLANSAIGQVLVNRNRLPQAIEAFRAASPLLKPDNFTYARNLYRLGFTLAKAQRISEARAVLTEAVSIDSPYKPKAQETLTLIGGPVRPTRPSKRP